MNDQDMSSLKLKWEFDNMHHCWQALSVIYCAHPSAPQLQCMNLFVPEAYLNADGTRADTGSCGGYTAMNAPVVFDNCIGGYSECTPDTLDSPRCQGMQYLDAGMVYVSVGARGKQTRTADGKAVGKAPAGLVDLKAAVRFLRHNREVLPGNTNRFISVGVSAGGAMSSLLGVTGNSKNYIPMLEEAGAAMDVTDTVYASQCYCPIIDLDHADIAYEWMFQGVWTADGMGPFCPGGPLSAFQRALSAELMKAYIPYFNSLTLREPETGLTLSFGRDGRSGSAYQYLMKVINQAATKHLQMLSDRKLPVSYSAEDYIRGNYIYEEPDFSQRPEPGKPPVMVKKQGTDKRDWLAWDGKQAQVKSLDDLTHQYVNRLKPCTAFDALDRGQAENQEFGDTAQDCMHFDTYMPAALAALADAFPEESASYEKEYAEALDNPAQERRKYLINPFSYIATHEIAETATYFRIRVGTHDPHTSFTMAMTLALKLAAAGADVDYAMVWDEPHGPADYRGEIVDWIRSIV